MPSTASKVKDFAATAAVVANIAVVIGFAVTITTKLDRIASRSQSNCVLLRSALVLGVEQSITSGTRVVSPEARATALRIERGFQAVPCS